MNPTKITGFLLLCLFMPAFFPNAYCETTRSPEQTEKRSCIKAVDGYAYLSDDVTMSQIRTSAFTDAKRRALEMAKSYIASRTKVENFTLKYDTVWSESEGAVSVLEQKDYGIEDNSRYHVWIKAEVEYRLRPKGKDSPVMEETAPLTVKVWTPERVYEQGEEIEILLRGNRDFYARIVDITPGGDIIQLLPNDIRKSSRFSGGRVYRIPGEKDLFELRVSPPYGEDTIFVYASEVPLGDVATESAENGLRLYRGSLESLGIQSRGISVQSHSSAGESGAEFYEASWSLETRP